MNFLFVDRILELNPGKETVGLKQVTPNDAFFGTDIDDNPILFPGIIGEALGQLCSWNVLKISDFSFRPVGGVIQEIQIFADAHLGDTILLESHIDAFDTDNPLVSFNGRASVQGKTLLTVKNSLAPLLPLHDFNDPEKVRSHFTRLYEPHTEDQQGADKEGQTIVTPYQFDYRIQSTDSDHVIAEKTISPSASYLADHFPKKPVFPLSLLIQYNLHLASTYINEQKKLRVMAVRKVKIGNFILPGDTVISRISIKERQAERYIVQFHNEVNNKKVCIAEAELGVCGHA